MILFATTTPLAVTVPFCAGVGAEAICLLALAGPVEPELAEQ
jgi:hypothetical protein